MREHPVIGERIVRTIPGLGPVARIIRHEHERFDGGGYPDGLKGHEIPVGARIILACDAYHAMTSDRPYRRAMSHAEAVRELANGAGSQFDPEVTEVLIGYLWAAASCRPGAWAPPSRAASVGGQAGFGVGGEALNGALGFSPPRMWRNLVDARASGARVLRD